MTVDDPYKVLQLPYGASGKEVKSAYRRLCRLYHPDVNPEDQQASARLQAVMAAYKQISEQQAAEPEAVGAFPDLGGESGRKQQEIKISFSRAFTGGQESITIPTQSLCRSCGGSGAAAGSHPQSCPQCQGSGRRHQGGAVAPCPDCQGRGFIIQQPCPDCQAGRISGQSRQGIVIPPGVWNGYRIPITAPGVQADVIINVSPSPIFHRYPENPENLYLSVPITYPEAVLGAKVTIPTPDKIVGLKIPPGTADGKKFKISGQGMPLVKNPEQRGDLLVKVAVNIPEQLSAKEQRIIVELGKAQSGQKLRQALLDSLDGPGQR
jgi:molecular chaperone DnaJ